VFSVIFRRHFPCFLICAFFRIILLLFVCLTGLCDRCTLLTILLFLYDLTDVVINLFFTSNLVYIHISSIDVFKDQHNCIVCVILNR